MYVYIYIYKSLFDNEVPSISSYHFLICSPGTQKTQFLRSCQEEAQLVPRHRSGRLSMIIHPYQPALTSINQYYKVVPPQLCLLVYNPQ